MTSIFASWTLGAALLYSAIKNMSLIQLLKGEPGPGQPASIVDAALASATGTEPLEGGPQRLTAGGKVPMGIVTPKRPWNPNNKPMCKWIAQELDKAYRAGARFTVSSGYRSVADQRRVCAETSGPCAEPGKSNHQGKAYPKCAVDIEGAESLAKHLPKGGRLHWTGKSIGDDVHFSSGKAGV